MPEAAYREAGAGPAVVCLHSNASSSGQWRALFELLAPTHHLFAPDSYGSGKSPPWEPESALTLDDEVALVEPVLAKAGDTFSLVGHSYGGALALKIALRHPQRVQSLVLYEPTMFALVQQHVPSAGSVQGILDAVSRASAALEAGDKDLAARHFIDFWMGEGSWDAMPEGRRAPIAESAVNVRRWRDALMRETPPPSAFAALAMPVLYLVGERSPEAAKAVARALVPLLPNVKVVEGPGWGHMAPITHADAVNGVIASFLRGEVH